MNGIFLILPAWLLLALPSLIAGMGQLIGSSAAVQRQNRYNSPFEQIKRLRAAGLPFAAYAAGQAGNQSQLPDFSGFNLIGSAIGQGLTQSNQLKMFTEMLRKAGFDADIAGNLKAISDEETKGLLEYTYKDPFGNQVPVARMQKIIEFQLKEYATWVEKHKADVAEIDKKIRKELFDSGKLSEGSIAEIDRIILSNKLAKQAFDTNEKRNAAQAKIVETMEKGGLSFWEALLIQILQGIGGGFSGGGFQFGF